MAGLYLASASPRRRELLAQIGVPFSMAAVAIDESALPNEGGADYVARLALAKARAAAAQLPSGAIVLGADTCGVLDGAILGKPKDRAQGLAMLSALSGREHDVLTAIAVVQDERQEGRLVSSRVLLRDLSAEERDGYWDSGEPADKAGGYAIQGLGGIFVRRLNGSYSAVVGLPLCETAELLAAFGVPCWQYPAGRAIEGVAP